jgi:hypothetical protein
MSPTALAKAGHQTFKTRQVAQLLSRTVGAIAQALRSGKINPLPERDFLGMYVWTPADVERLRAAFAIDRRRKEHKQPRGGAK